MRDNKDFKHPYDTPLSSGLRFLSELIAWIAGPWAAGQVSNWLIVPTLIVLVGLPAVFSTPNDKNQVVIPTPGPIRVVLESFLYGVAAITPWFIWPPTWAGLATVIVILTIVSGFPRTAWLLKRAPER